MTDLEQQLREAMSASVASARPSFSVVDIRHRHRRHRRVLTIVSMASAVVVLLTVRASLHGLSAPPPVNQGHTDRYVDRSFGWRVRYPRGWVFAHLHGGVLVDLGPALDGFRLTNFTPDLKLDTPNPGAPIMAAVDITGWLKAFPADGVAVQLLLTEELDASSLHDNAFPLSAASFHRVSRSAGGSEPRPLSRTFYGDGLQWSVAVWAGPRASSADVRSAWAAVRSLRFAVLKTGTAWQGMYYVLGSATQYPVGSVTAVSESSLPKASGGQQSLGIYLVHAPRGFYAIGMYFGTASIRPARSRRCPTLRQGAHLATGNRGAAADRGVAASGLKLIGYERL